MQDLLPHYERELAFLRAHAEEFGRRYPRVAGRLAVAGEVLQDPHVERMIQAFALLTSRIHKRLDDDFPRFAESFLDLLYPHYLRPVPSSAIACFDAGESGAQLGRAVAVPRGTELHARPLRGVTCRFRTTAPAQVLPLRLAAVKLQTPAVVPSGTGTPRGTAAILSIGLELTSPQASWRDLGTDHLRIHLDGAPSLVAVLREALTRRTLATLVQTAPAGAWAVDGDCLPRSVGFGADEALVEADARSHTAYRLLTEYFAFPEKFHFVDLPVPAAARCADARSIELHLALGAPDRNRDDARLLEVAGPANLLLNCVPITNLFATRADPIRLTHAATMHPVLPDGRRASGHEVYAIDRVYRVRQAAGGETIQAFKPFYSLQHDDLLQDPEGGGRYWFSQRNASPDLSPGYETEIGIVDLDFSPSVPQVETLSIEVRATNRDLPTQLGIGNPGGDLFAEGGGAWREIRLLRKPTRPCRIEGGQGVVWRLISQLSLNHLSLTGGGIDALREMLRLYDLPRSATNQRLVDGLVAVDYRPVHAYLEGEPFASLVRGTEIRLAVDDTHFVGAGLHLFAEVMDRFFGLYAHVNSFTQLCIVCARTDEVLYRGPRRSGAQALV